MLVDVSTTHVSIEIELRLLEVSAEVHNIVDVSVVGGLSSKDEVLEVKFSKVHKSDSWDTSHTRLTEIEVEFEISTSSLRISSLSNVTSSHVAIEIDLGSLGISVEVNYVVYIVVIL